MSDFLMPSLGADMEAGTLLEWYVKPGDAVKRGDIVAVVDTSKAEIEVEIFEDGVIDELLVGEGARVPVGTALATVRPVGVEAKPAVATAGQAQAEPVPVPSPLARPRRAAAHADASPGASVPGAPPPPPHPARRQTTGCASPRSPGERPSSSAWICRRSPEADLTGRSRRPTWSASRRVAAPRPVDAANAARPPQPCANRPSGGDAPGDRRADGTLQARDPALLPAAARST